ncbi:hypothetical protein [Aliivibrio fischeri]|uniref:hypothetical protein n=1 Tax=Aliivibrio fischeri TaxID=668 RepID=UPI0007C4A00A|nr:hypothetical protein [Aliivibrio fischeri]
MLRLKFKEKIGTVLSSNSFFSLYDFIISESKSSVKIEYGIDPRYCFSFVIPSSQSSIKDMYGTNKNIYIYRAEISPWETAIKENTEFESQDLLLNGISRWLTFLKEDLNSTPTLRRIERIEEKFLEFSKKADSFNGEYFTVEESENLKAKFEELSKKMEDAINTLSIQSEEKTERINTLQEEIESLKCKLDILDKRGVIRSFVGQLMQWSSKSENQTLIEGAGAIAKELIEQNSPLS